MQDELDFRPTTSQLWYYDEASTSVSCWACNLFDLVLILKCIHHLLVIKQLGECLNHTLNSRICLAWLWKFLQEFLNQGWDLVSHELLVQLFPAFAWLAYKMIKTHFTSIKKFQADLVESQMCLLFKYLPFWKSNYLILVVIETIVKK